MSEPWLPSDHEQEAGALQKRVARGLTWTLIDTWGSQLLGLIVFVLLARLLDADDFGLVALAAVFVALAQLLVDQGLGDALIQRPSLTRSQIDTAFWVAVVTGVLLTLISIVLAGPIAGLLRQPQIAPIVQVLSLTFVMVALNSIQMALLRREMRFRSLAIRKLLAVGIGGVVGIAMAVLDPSPWALVGQQLAAAAVSVVALWAVSPWRPGRHVSRAEFWPLFSFGIHIVGGDILNFLSRNTDKLLIGASMGTGPLGFYAVAYRILDTSQVLLVNAARKLAFPVFSRLQHDRDRIRRAYSRVNRALSVVTMPAYVGLALVASEAIPLIFGDRWTDSAPVAAVLFLIGPVLTVQLFSGALMNAVGHPEVTFRIRLITSIVNVVGFVIAVTLFGTIIAVAAAFVVRGYLVMPLILWWLRKYAGVPFSAHLSELRTPALATLAMSGAVIAVKLALPGLAPGALLAVETAVGASVFIGAMLIIERALLIEVVTLILQASPPGAAVARRLGVTLPEGLSLRSGGKDKGGRGRRCKGRGGHRRAAEEQEVVELEMEREELISEGTADDTFAPDAGLGRGTDV